MNIEIESEGEYLEELLVKLSLVGRAVERWQKFAEIAQQPKGWIRNPQRLHQEIRDHLICMIGHPLIVMYELSKHPDFRNLKDEVLDKLNNFLEH